MSVSLRCFLQGRHKWSSSCFLRFMRKKKPCHIPSFLRRVLLSTWDFPAFHRKYNITNQRTTQSSSETVQEGGSLCVGYNSTQKRREVCLSVCPQKTASCFCITGGAHQRTHEEEFYVGFWVHLSPPGSPVTCSLPLQVLEETRPLPSPSSILSLVGGPFSGENLWHLKFMAEVNGLYATRLVTLQFPL